MSLYRAVVLGSSGEIGNIESLVLRLYDLADEAAHGSYSASQRAELNAEFQEILGMIDPAVNRSGINGVNMLDSADEIIRIKARGEVLEFGCVDITVAGLKLDGGIRLYGGPLSNIWPHFNTKAAFDLVEAAVRRVKEVDLQFVGYINTLSEYIRMIDPITDWEVRQGLEIMEASKEGAELIESSLEHAVFLMDLSISDGFPDDQRYMINIIRFQEVLKAIDRISSGVYYGMGIGMIDSTDIFVIETGEEMLEFLCFDLSSAGLGLDGGFRIETAQEAADAYPHVIDALQSVEDAITSLNDYIDTLLEYAEIKGHSNLIGQRGRNGV